jgi:hypothetical protein
MSEESPISSSSHFIFRRQHKIGLSKIDFTEAADRIESGEAGLTELLAISAQVSRLANAVPSSLRKQPAFANPFAGLSKLRGTTPESQRKELAAKVREFAATVPELPPDDLPLPVHQFDISLIPIIMQIIQMIMDMVTKFRS